MTALKLLLIVANVDPNCIYDGLSALHHAVLRNRLDVVELLCSRPQIDINVRCVSGATPLFVAISPEVIRFLLSQPHINVNARNNCGKSALHFMISSRHIAALVEDRRVDVNLVDVRGKSCLHAIAESGDNGKVNALLQRGDVDVNTRDNDGRTPLGMARDMHNDTVAKTIEDHGGIL